MTSGSWHGVVAEDALPEGDKLAARVNGWFVLIARQDGVFFAVNDRCTHQASLLSGGKVRRGVVMCPLHGARYELANGRCIGGGYRDLRIFPVRVHDGMIEVGVPDAAPSLEELPVIV